MKNQFLTKAMVGAALMAMAATASALQWGNVASAAKDSQSGGFIVRSVWPLDGEGFDVSAKNCMENGPGWRKADAKGRERLMEIGRDKMRQLAKTHDTVVAMRTGLLVNKTAYLMVPKGAVKIGDEVTFRVGSMRQEWNGVECPNPGNANGKLAVDKIIKHHSGNLLFANGKFIDKIPSNGEAAKVEPKPKPKSRSVLDL